MRGMVPFVETSWPRGKILYYFRSTKFRERGVTLNFSSKKYLDAFYPLSSNLTAAPAFFMIVSGKIKSVNPYYN